MRSQATLADDDDDDDDDNDDDGGDCDGDGDGGGDHGCWWLAMPFLCSRND